jgi:cytochrome c551/c552
MQYIRASLAAVLALAVWSGMAAADAAKAPDGKPVFLKYKCNSCHSIASQKIETKKETEETGAAAEKPAAGDADKSSNVKPPDLSGVGVDHTAEWIALFLVKKEKVENQTHPKKFRGTDDELTTIGAWLATMKDEAAAKKASADLKKSAASAPAAATTPAATTPAATTAPATDTKTDK